jgi:hypothetical protein
LTNTTTGTDTYSNLTTSQRYSITFDPNDPKVFYSFYGLTIQKNTMLGGGVISSATLYTYPGSASSINTGGDSETTQDGWQSFYTDGPDFKAGIINLYNPSQVYLTPSYAGSGKTFRLTQVTQVNSANNKRYLLVGFYANLAADRYSLTTGGSSLAFEGMLPKKPVAQGTGYYAGGATCDTATSTAGLCLGVGHSAVQDVGGIQYYVYQYQAGYPYSDWYVWMRLDTGDLMATPVEAGGGMYVPGFPLTMQGQSQFDEHVGAATGAPVAVVSTDSDPILTCGQSACGQAPPYSLSIVNVSAGSPTIISYAESDTPIANGDVQWIAGTRGMTGVNGSCTVAALNTIAKTYSCSGSTSTGTFVAGFGGAVLQVTPTTVNMPHQTNVLLFDATKISQNKWTVTKLATSRSFSMRGSSTDGIYFGQAQCAIARNGTVVSCSTNNLNPDTYQVISMPTGYVAPNVNTMFWGTAVSATIVK